MQNRILIVEDEEMIARALQIELEHEGYQVLVEREGKSGLEAALHNSIDLVLLDVMLPELSGIEVLRRIRKKNAYLHKGEIEIESKEHIGTEIKVTFPLTN